MSFFGRSLPIFAFVTLVSLAQAAPQRLRQAISDSQITVLRGNVPHLAQAQYDRGPVSSSMRIQGASIVFNRSPAQQADAAKLLAQLQDPRSPNYHKWLTPQQYADRFGMSQADIDKVVVWLRSHGLRVDRVATSRNQIFFSGTAAQIQAALHTQLHQFMKDGEIHFANSTEPAVPSAIAGSVLAVRNLNNFRPKPRRMKARKISAQSHFTSGQGNHFISPDDLATIYNIQPLYALGIDGESAIAVVGQTEVNQADITAFRTAAGLSGTPFQAVLVPGSGSSTVVAADALEADLDVEWTGAVARNSTIVYVYTGNGTNLNVIDALQYAVDQNLAPVISISYGLCEASAGLAGRNFLQSLAQQANAQGQSISAATGDQGAADCEDAGANTATHGLAVDVPAAIPEITGVGGSQFSGDVNNGSTYWSSVNNGNNASALSYIPETSWNDTAQTVADGNGFSSGGGGQSSFFPKPSYQQGVTGVPAANHRYVPDIALNASAHHDGYLVCSQGNCKNGFIDSDDTILLVGGTSVGAPVFAGLAGLINQVTESNGQGNVNPTLYQLSSSTPNAFHDITTGNNKVPCTSNPPSTDCPSGTTSIGYNAAAGYDLATGLGSLDMFKLVSAWPGFNTTPAYTMTSNPSTIAIASAGKSGTSTVTVTSTSGFIGTVALTCSAPPNLETGCSIIPTSVDLSASVASATATLTVATTAAHVASASATSTPGSFFATGVMILAGVFALVIPSRGRRTAALFAVFLFGFLVAGIGCGGGNSPTPTTPSTPSDPGTAAGGYTVVVKGTSGSVAHSTNISVTVP
jgi:pseudomonalisin